MNCSLLWSVQLRGMGNSASRRGSSYCGVEIQCCLSKARGRSGGEGLLKIELSCNVVRPRHVGAVEEKVFTLWNGGAASSFQGTWAQRRRGSSHGGMELLPLLSEAHGRSGGEGLRFVE